MHLTHLTPRRLPAPIARRWRAIPPRALPTLLITALAAAYIVVAPPSVDLAAADYRAWLFGHTHFAIWDLRWYGGDYLPTYSLLVPALSWLLGVRWLGALSVIAATGLFQRLVGPAGRRGLVAVAWFGFALLCSLLSGRITFTAAVPVALAALYLDRRGDPGPGHAACVLALSAGTALLSPVASLFLAVAWAALLVTRRKRFYVAALAMTFGPIAILNVAFHAPGVEPFSPTGVIPLAIATVSLLAMTSRRRDAITVGLLLYLAAAVLTSVIHTPVGGNVLRLGPLLAGPLFLLRVDRRRRLVLALAALPLIYWPCSDAIRDLRATVGNPTVHASFYTPLIDYLQRTDGPRGEAAHGGFRVEIPPVSTHWEARWVAPHFAIARGWERQSDTADNALFYRPGLTAARYRRWLHADAIRYVALPLARLDYSAQAERRVIDSRPAYLVPVFSDREWRVYRVRDATPVVTGAHLIAMTSDSLTIVTARQRRAIIRVRWNPYWKITSGSGCVGPFGSWTEIDATRAQTVRLGERFSMARLGSHQPRCSP